MTGTWLGTVKQRQVVRLLGSPNKQCVAPGSLHKGGVDLLLIAVQSDAESCCTDVGVRDKGR